MKADLPEVQARVSIGVDPPGGQGLREEPPVRCLEWGHQKILGKKSIIYNIVVKKFSKREISTKQCTATLGNAMKSTKL